MMSFGKKEISKLYYQIDNINPTNKELSKFHFKEKFTKNAFDNRYLIVNML